MSPNVRPDFRVLDVTRPCGLFEPAQGSRVDVQALAAHGSQVPTTSGEATSGSEKPSVEKPPVEERSQPPPTSGEAISGEAISGSEKPPVEKPATSGGKKLKPTTGGIATSGTARQHTVAAAKAAVQGSTQLQQQPRQHAAAAAWQRTTAAAWQHTTAAAWQHTAAATRQQHYAQRSKHRS